MNLNESYLSHFMLMMRTTLRGFRHEYHDRKGIKLLTGSLISRSLTIDSIDNRLQLTIDSINNRTREQLEHEANTYKIDKCQTYLAYFPFISTQNLQFKFKFYSMSSDDITDEQ